MTVVAHLLSLLVAFCVAFALTFGTARYGATGFVLGLLGLVPLVALRRRVPSNPVGRPGRGAALMLGLLAMNALALSVAVAVGAPDLGRLDYALLAAGLLSVLWLHAAGHGHFFWAGLATLGLVTGGVAFVAFWIQAGVNDPQAGAEAWWRSGWGPLAPIGVVCATVAVIVRWVSRRALAVRGPSEPAGASRPPGQIAGPRLTRAVGPPVVDPAALAARKAVGQEGERRVRELLLDRLPAGTLVLNNLELPGLGGDVDLLVVGSTGVFVPEVKTWSGQISCAADGRTWSRITTGGQWEALPDPAAQTQREIRALRAYLEEADPELCRRTQLWIDGFLVFAHPRASLDAAASPVPALVPEAAVARMREAVPRRPLTPSDQQRIVALLEQVQPLELVREMDTATTTTTHP